MIALLAVMACTGPDSDTGSTRPDPPGPPDFVLSAEDRETYKAFETTLQTYTLNPKTADAYDSLFPDELQEDGELRDYRPTFYLLRPKDPEETPQAALFYLHGGTLADDSSFGTDGILPRHCDAESILGLTETKLQQRLMPLAMAAEKGWMVILPRNDWCDFWLGQGPQDPHAEWHYGGIHFERVLDFLADGKTGIALPERRFLWGTSAGGGAAAHLAARLGGFDALIVDSAPSNLFEYYKHDPATLDFQFGGPPSDEDGEPTEFWPDYADASAHSLVSSGQLQIPVFQIWNSEDTLVPPVHAESLIAALEQSSIAFGSKDLRHPSPGEKFHVQSTRASLPAAYTPAVLFSFLEGATLSWQEAEGLCDVEAPSPCTLGTDVYNDEQSPLSVAALSGAAGRQALATEGAGTLWAAEVPDDLLVDRDLEALFVLRFDGIDTLPEETLVATIQMQSASQSLELPLQVRDLLTEGPQRSDVIAHIRSTGLAFQLSAGEQAQLRLHVEGKAEVLLDAVVYLSSAASP
jgi:acetyl esterase/lipase